MFPLDYSDMFVPGLKTRICDHPPSPKMGGNRRCSDENKFKQPCRKSRHANVMLGRGPDGQHRKLWMSMSQSPERRRKARLAGKVKRAVLEMWGQAAKLEVEFSRDQSGMAANDSAAPPWTYQRRGNQLAPDGSD